ncbi:MAG: hypothetical protein WA725_00910, partial [Pseudolabrys sp.]
MVDNTRFTAERGDDAVEGLLLMLGVGRRFERRRRRVRNNPDAECGRQCDKNESVIVLGVASKAAKASSRRTGVALARQSSVAAEN